MLSLGVPDLFRDGRRRHILHQTIIPLAPTSALFSIACCPFVLALLFSIVDLALSLSLSFLLDIHMLTHFDLLVSLLGESMGSWRENYVVLHCNVFERYGGRWKLCFALSSADVVLCSY
jgi:hypothetical protein